MMELVVFCVEFPGGKGFAIATDQSNAAQSGLIDITGAGILFVRSTGLLKRVVRDA